MASWAAVFLVDMWMYRRRDGYDETELYSSAGRYGAFNWAGIVSFVVAVFIGLGLITSFSPVFENWVGYLLGPFGGKTGTVGRLEHRPARGLRRRRRPVRDPRAWS